MTAPWTKARAFFRRMKEEKEIATVIQQLLEAGEHNLPLIRQQQLLETKKRHQLTDEDIIFLGSIHEDIKHAPFNIETFAFVGTESCFIARDGNDICAALDKEKEGDSENTITKDVLRDVFASPSEAEDEKNYLGYSYTRKEFAQLSRLLSQQATFAIRLRDHEESHFKRFNYIELELLKNFTPLKNAPINIKAEAEKAQPAIIEELQSMDDALDEMVREHNKRGKRSLFRVVWRNPDMS